MALALAILRHAAMQELILSGERLDVRDNGTATAIAVWTAALQKGRCRLPARLQVNADWTHPGGNAAHPHRASGAWARTSAGLVGVSIGEGNAASTGSQPIRSSLVVASLRSTAAPWCRQFAKRRVCSGRVI